jgi:single-strand DNA-binding protein
MSRSLNNVQILGHLGQDAEVRFTPTGIQVARLNIATSRSYKDKNSDEWKEKTTWHNVTLWRCEKVAEFLKKGKQVFVQGHLDTRSYEDKEGVKRYITEIVSEELILLGGGDGSRASGGGSRGNSAAAGPAQSDGQGITDDDVPF